ncbi:hypothetical protein YPPY29_1744, partial [Yersinia pestis PY-29]
MRAVVKTR